MMHANSFSEKEIDGRTVRKSGKFDTREELVLEINRMSALNMTKTEIAAACHVSTTTVWRIMNGDHSAYKKPRVSDHSNDEVQAPLLNEHWIVPDTSHLTDDCVPDYPFSRLGNLYEPLPRSN